MLPFLRRIVLSAFAALLPLLAVFAFLAAAPASAARPAAVVPCDTPSLITAVSNAVSAGGTQTLTLAASCAYTLTTVNNGSGVDLNGLPLITHTVRLTINGSGATILRDAGAPRFRLFQVAAGASLTLDSLTLTGGHTPDGVSASGGNGGNGGAILNSGGTLTLTHSFIRGNLTGNGGNCCSTVSDGSGGKGAGAFNDSGSLIVSDSTVAGNSTGAGGAAGNGIGGSGGGLGMAEGSVMVVNSTLSGNRTGDGNPSGDFDAAGLGGGMVILSGTLSVTNSTLAGNSTGDSGGGGPGGMGAALAVLDTLGLTLTNNTIASNTVGNFGSAGGISVFHGPLLLQNNLFAHNIGGNCGFSSAASVSGASTHNMADTNDCGVTFFTPMTATQINLGPLADNGGPSQTMALRFPSAAIDAGDNASCPAVDQRGQPRPVGLACDIGAFEFQTVLSHLFLPAVRR